VHPFGKPDLIEKKALPKNLHLGIHLVDRLASENPDLEFILGMGENLIHLTLPVSGPILPTLDIQIPILVVGRINHLEHTFAHLRHGTIPRLPSLGNAVGDLSEIRIGNEIDRRTYTTHPTQQDQTHTEKIT
jgi:hypothetical protein